jgi:hypothetical protein
MSGEQIQFTVLFRNPEYPVIIRNIRLSLFLILYNESSTVAASDKKYSLKSLSNKRLNRIIEDICDLLR